MKYVISGFMFIYLPLLEIYNYSIISRLVNFCIPEEFPFYFEPSELGALSLLSGQVSNQRFRLLVEGHHATQVYRILHRPLRDRVPVCASFYPSRILDTLCEVPRNLSYFHLRNSFNGDI